MLVAPEEIRVAAAVAALRRLSAGVDGSALVLLPRLRRAGLSGRRLAQRNLLAGRMAAVESLQQLRHTVPRAMGRDGALPALAHLPAAAAALVTGSLLPAAPLARRRGHAPPRPALDQKRIRRGVRRRRVHARRTGHLVSAMAQLHRRPRLDAVGGAAGRTKLA